MEPKPPIGPSLLLLEIRQAINTVMRIREGLSSLGNSAIASKGHTRIMVGRDDWSDVIMEAKNLTLFLAEDVIGITDQMCEVIESVDELKNLLDNMRV
jgi:hypothetical protein